MKIRRLKIKDKVFMYEWMHDDDVTRFLNVKFHNKTLADCEKFIASSIHGNDINLAIVDDTDEYLGTISLKNIDKNNKIAEMAIVVRKCAMGKGVSKFALDEIFAYGRNILGINTFYWFVKPENVRAVKFYNKNGYKTVSSIKGIDFLDSKYYWYIAH